MSPNALLHPFANPAKPEGDFIEIVRAEGCELFDADGVRYLDAMASLWYCQIGHGRREVIAAIAAQLEALPTYSIFDPFTNGPAREAAALIASKSPHPDGRVFLGCSGSEAVDTALKLARLVQGRTSPDRQIIVRRRRGYHGTNFGGTSAQGIAPNREGWGDLVPHFVEVEPDDIEATARLFAEQGDRIAAVITEPIQAAGGVHPPTDGYLEGLRRLCDQHGALLIFDEVICGFGRTGSWFGSQTFGVTPDMMTFAKGVTSGYLPLSGVVVSRAVADRLEAADEVLRTGYTYSGHPTACAAAIANIGIIEAEGLVERANHIGCRLGEAFAALADDGTIQDYRGLAGVWAVDTGGDAPALATELRSHGVVLRGAGTDLFVCPPLVVKDEELDEIVESIATVLS